MKINSEDPITVEEISDKDEKVRNLFSGKIINAKFRSHEGIEYIEIEGITKTFDYDVKLKRRSFPNPNMTYNDIIDKIISEYNGDYIDTISNDKKIGKIIVQYDETDWTFFKRLASHFGGILVPDIEENKPRFWFGITESKEAKNIKPITYNVKKDIDTFQISAKNFDSSLNHQDYFTCEVESYNYYKIGDEINLNNKTLKVKKIVREMKDSRLIYTYTLVMPKGIRQNFIPNRNIKGASLEGFIIDVSRNVVKVKLDIDSEQSVNKANWFPYAAEGNQVWVKVLNEL